MWERETLSEYMDLDPLLAEEVIPEPMADIDVSLPSESYQDFNFVASGESRFITTLLLLIVDNETPSKIVLNQRHVKQSANLV